MAANAVRFDKVQWGRRLARWVRGPVRLEVVAVVVLASAATLAALSATPKGVAFERYVASAADYRGRSWLHRDPVKSPKLKVFAIDDSTVAFAQSVSLPLKDWSVVVEALAKQRPKAIVIDKLFDGVAGESDADAAAFRERLSGLSTRVVSGAFTSASAIPLRQALGGALRARSAIRATAGGEERFVYGPDPRIEEAFSAVGHVDYAQDGAIEPLRGAAGGLALTYLGLATADLGASNAGEITLGNRLLPVGRGGKVAVDLASPDSMRAWYYSFKELLRRARSGEPIPIVEEGDVVLLVAAHYTGHTDWVESPHGNIPGSYVVAATLNSVLTGRWLTQAPGGVAWTFLTATVGALLALRLRGYRFALVAALGAPMLMGVGILGFALAGAIVPWLYPTAAFALVLGIVFAYRVHVEKIEQVRLKGEIQTAKLVQSFYLNRPHAQSPTVAVVGKSLSASECCGDLWLHEDVGDGRCYVVVGDAMGHGASAALLTATAYGVLMTMLDLEKSGVITDPGPARFATMLAHVLHSATKGTHYMSTVVIEIKASTREVTVCNAGHIPPLLVRKNEGRVETRKVSGVRNPLPGLAANSRYEQQRLRLEVGERLLLYSDGLTERENRDGTQLRESTVRTQVAKWGDVPLQNLVDGLFRLVGDHGAGVPQDDDITIVGIEITESEATVRADATGA